ncbi:MAG: fructose-6-phosphate aldolase [Alphaproteobacteria bacterium]|nr:fructose-6-phosphate aldolase [Alphaproteobacteria bacterium]
MKIFLDTANIDDIDYYKDFIDGVTTNPSILSKYDVKNHKNTILKICRLVRSHVSVEVVSDTAEDMLKEGRELAKLHNQICVKLPCTYDGLRVCKILSEEGIATNVTLCFSATQAVLAAKCGATYISPFIGRLDDVGQDGLSLIDDICEIYRQQGFETNVLAASVRNSYHVTQAIMSGVDAITMSPKILKSCLEHNLTNVGLQLFAEDWKNRKK